MDPSKEDLESTFQEVEGLVKFTKMAVFVFIIGYFKAPTSLLLPYKDHSSGHYVTYDLRRLTQWPGVFLQVVVD
jgi:hypothetical protein